MNKLVIPMIILFLLSGCVVSEEKHNALVKEVQFLKSEIETIKKSHGGFLYMGINPEISFLIKDVEFHVTRDAYGSPDVSYKAYMKQNNKDFPLPSYNVQVTFLVINENGDEVDKFYTGFSIENGVASLAEIQKLYSVKMFKAEGYKLKVLFYEWMPNNKLKPHEI